ncbi:MAG: SDR family NAD(P)-dependent oxidoreductase [Candidatus Gastranaerophilales bacterium]|nr:SDR family NAD(P)-dependent oxidoreductase [Candidatus Gastranaerophilales bacterium]
MDNIFNENILLNKVIVIIGGTKGVAKSLVKECSKYGANVVFAARDKIVAENIVSNYKNTDFFEADISDVNQIRNFFQYVISKYQRIDGFVNYSGITPVDSIIETSEDVFDNVFDINLKAPFFACKYVLQQMMNQKNGSIVLIGSPHAWGGDEDRAAYSVSKGALFSLSEHISHNYAKYGIRCNYLTMGWTPTEGELALRSSQNISPETLIEDASNKIPFGRMNTLDDYIPTLILLLSDYSEMVIGSNFRITGGLYI